MPKRVIATGFALLLLALFIAPASAQTRYIGVYFDWGLTTEQANCPSAPPLTVADTIWIAMVDWDMNVSGVQFKVDYPPEMVWLGDQAHPPVYQGNTRDGFAVGFAIPQNGYFPILVTEAVFAWDCNGCTSTDIPVKVVGHPLLGGTITATRWPDQTKFNGIGLTALICTTVPVEETTWGQVKALYNEQ